MMLMTVFFPSFLYASVVALKPDNENKENGYLMSFTIFSRAFDWSEEEQLPQKVFKHNLGNQFKFKNYSWAVGVRGKDVFGRRYVNPQGTSGCMASLINVDRAMTPCTCVLSWYTSYRANPNNASMFRPHPKRTVNDITAPYLFIHHTLHEGPSYFVDEDVRHYGIRNDPIFNFGCSQKSVLNSTLLELTLVLLEVESPVVINDVPAVVPTSVMYENPEEIELAYEITGWKTLTLLTYGTRLKLLNEIIFPDGRKPVVGQRLDLREELIAFRLNMVRNKSDRSKGANCGKFGFDFTKPGMECWKVYSSLPLCHILAGAPVISNDGSRIYGIVMNELLCEDDPLYDKLHVEPGYFELVRLGGPFPEIEEETNYIGKLRTHYENFISKRDENKEMSRKTQKLFNFSEGLLDYQEDFGPSVLLKIKTHHSIGVRISGSLDFVMSSFLGALFVQKERNSRAS